MVNLEKAQGLGGRNTMKRNDTQLEQIRSRVILLISVFALAGCWQSEDRIYMAEDYFIPVQSELVSISDEFGPLGIYEINSENQYRPVFRDAESNSFEQKFRVFNI